LLPDKENATGPHLAIVVSANEVLDVWNMARDANPGGKHDHYSIVSKRMLYPIWSIDKYKELFVGIPIQLPGKARP
jgi:hypothetical protein